MFGHSYFNIVFSSVAVYLFIILAIRLFGKKELSQLSIADLVFILLISNAVQNAMVGPDTSLAGGLVAAGALFVANFVLKLIFHKFPKIGKLIQGEPILLVYKGKLNRKNLERAQLTLDELQEAIREHGVSVIEDVDLAVLEIDGNISVLSDEFRHRTVRKRKMRRLTTGVGQE